MTSIKEFIHSYGYTLYIITVVLWVIISIVAFKSSTDSEEEGDNTSLVSAFIVNILNLIYCLTGIFILKVDAGLSGVEVFVLNLTLFLIAGISVNKSSLNEYYAKRYKYGERVDKLYEDDRPLAEIVRDDHIKLHEIQHEHTMCCKYDKLISRNKTATAAFVATLVFIHIMLSVLIYIFTGSLGSMFMEYLKLIGRLIITSLIGMAFIVIAILINPDDKD